MLSINLDTVLWVVRATREFHAKEEVVFPDDSPDGNDGDWAMQILADHGSDLTLQELRIGLRGLEPGQQAELLALKWLGRGDYGSSEWEEAKREALENWSPEVMDRLIATPLISEYLLEALDILGIEHEE
ncbi:hypothetical protein TVNIR_0554 [Thioalkalivibrio nitratireducens DSM 14787]|uniref:DUF3775 domain-containing protein n=1 Tax=Thioalkalivibrio nitratireducens (strain DSM 14787 / UNIQEM 213 / ALEN2) TaxID=1255043 RepID=L0DV60_THIND|nr:DUF3775 domain-containing protein [Thioalkalivibrio nitratireducens]AGA32256.1 hypothetical protein TVNIR_0554 [Thioalkalivibrio nitratireducens DSM 14787]